MYYSIGKSVQTESLNLSVSAAATNVALRLPHSKGPGWCSLITFLYEKSYVTVKKIIKFRHPQSFMAEGEVVRDREGSGSRVGRVKENLHQL